MTENNNKSVTIVIPVKSYNPYLIECIENCLNLEYQKFDILVMPDEGFQINDLVGTVAPPSDLPATQSIATPSGDAGPTHVCDRKWGPPRPKCAETHGHGMRS